jgi:carbon monoxide dehydrogenase subunit G
VLDFERVAPTVPGAQILEQTDENTYKVAIKVKVGPMSITYKGEVEITERDEQAHRAVMKARAKESRGQGTADADVTMVLSGENGRTSATVTTEVELSGKAATMGQGVLQDVAGRLVATFSKNLAAMLEGGGAPPPTDAARPAQAPEAATPAPATPEVAPPAPATPEVAPPAPATPDAAPRAPEVARPAPAGAPAPSAEGEGPGTAPPVPPPAAPPPPAPAAPAPARPAAEPEDALDLGSLGGAVIADRLQDPRQLGGLLALVALFAYVLGRRSG